MNLGIGFSWWGVNPKAWEWVDFSGRDAAPRRPGGFEQAFGSEGTIENSPAFQCRETVWKNRVPQGRQK